MPDPTRSQIPAAAGAVFALFVAVGGFTLYTVAQDPAPVERAVSGSPGGPPPPAGDELPPQHPSIELPEEARRFLDELGDQADAAPDDPAIWLRLSQARYRASLLTPAYANAARAAVDRVLSLSPDNAEAHKVAGHLAYDSERFPPAEKHYRRFLELAAEDAGVLTNLGSVVLFQERPDEALEIYRRAIELDENFLQAHFNLGYALHQQGDTDAALAAFRRALELADEPSVRQRIEDMIAVAEGREPAPPATPPGGAPVAPAAPRNVESNATTPMQKAVDAALVTYPVLGPKVGSVAWDDDVTASVSMVAFPMDQMPEVARMTFKNGLGAKLVEIAAETESAQPIVINLLDAATGRVMETVGGAPEAAAYPATP